MTTDLLTARAAALLEAAESMIGMLRDHADELARGESPHLLTATDAYSELQQAAHALRLHFDSPYREDVTAFDALVAMHAYLLEEKPGAYFELTFCSMMRWCVWLCSNSLELDPKRKVLAFGQGDTSEEACERALDQLTEQVGDIPEHEIPY